MANSNLPPRRRSRRAPRKPRRLPATTTADARADADLIDAMRRNDPTAWVAFDARFRPVLEAHAKRANIPRWEWSACITELLADEALRLSQTKVEVPRSLDAYLVRASRNRYLHTKRSMSCRDRNYVAASEHRLGEWVVPSTCSEAARRASAGPDAPRSEMSNGLRRLAEDLAATLTDEERAILAWIAEGVSRGTIATWLGIGHDACTKRVWRLCHRLRAEAIARSADYSLRDRRDVDRFIARANGGAGRRSTRVESPNAVGRGRRANVRSDHTR